MRLSLDLFISHSSVDAGAARELRAELEAAGYSCWMAPDDVTGTDTWAEQILGAIEQCRAMIVLVSAGANASTHVSREVSLALGRKRALLPVRIEAVSPQGPLEYLLSLVQRVDAFPPPIASHRTRILKRVEATLGAAGGAVKPGGIDPTAALGPGSVVDEFTIEGLLGEGGMATVYRALQAEPRRAVALKVVRADRAADPAFRERFLAERETLVALEHPSIVPIYDIGDAGGRLYLAMRLVNGMDLQARIARDGSLSLKETARILEPIADAIDYAHESGVVHRDLKPSNILLDASNHPYLTDFGLGKRLDGTRSLSEPGFAIGTLAYMAPEQLEASSAAASAPAIDIYALACVAFACLTGAPAFPQSSAEQVLASKVGEPPSVRTLRPDLPPRVAEVIAVGMAKDPAKRHASARELVAELAEPEVVIVDGDAGETVHIPISKPTSPVDRLVRWVQSNRPAAVLGVAIALVAVIADSAGVLSRINTTSIDPASPSPASSAPASGGPGPSVSPAFSSPPALVPLTEAEQALLRTIPVLGPKEKCRRWDLAAGNEAILVKGAYDQAIAGIACPASAGVGDSSMIYQAFFEDDDELEVAYEKISAQVAGTGSCISAVDVPGRTPWAQKIEGDDVTSGTLACLIRNGAVQYVWTHPGLGVLVQVEKGTYQQVETTWSDWINALSEEERALQSSLPELSTPKDCVRAADRHHVASLASLVCPAPNAGDPPVYYTQFASPEDARAAYLAVMKDAGYGSTTPTTGCLREPQSDGNTGWHYGGEADTAERGLIGCHDGELTWTADSLAVLGEWTSAIGPATDFFGDWVNAIRP